MASYHVIIVKTFKNIAAYQIRSDATRAASLPYDVAINILRWHRVVIDYYGKISAMTLIIQKSNSNDNDTQYLCHQD